MSNQIQLPKCHYYGPGISATFAEWVTLPKNAGEDPFAFLPEPYELSEEERDLAARYEQGDFSGGYMSSQIAYFRRPKPQARHEQRRQQLRKLQALVQAAGLQLPDSFVKLVENDDAIDRIRHNNIWLRVPEQLVPFPQAPAHQLASVFYEGQGCGHWHLLLSPGPSHVMVFTEDSLGVRGEYPPGCEPDLTTFTFYECASSFDEWLTYYFLDCTACDRHYEASLKKYPGA